jgi:hypothetical protein
MQVSYFSSTVTWFVISSAEYIIHTYMDKAVTDRAVKAYNGKRGAALLVLNLGTTCYVFTISNVNYSCQRAK